MNKKHLTSILILLGVILGWFGYSALGPENNVSEDNARVLKVIDGDTFKIKNNVRVRLLGIDSPEKGECFYEEARDALKGLVGGEIVRLDKDISDKDRYERLLRYVILEKDGEDNLFVNDYLVREGFAFDIAYPPDNRYRDLLSSAGEEAKRERNGLWAACDYEEALDLREEDSAPLDPDCVIKGNISEKGYGKTYLISGCDNYNRVKIDVRKGEAYFCSEEEAINAGFRKATNCP